MRALGSAPGLVQEVERLAAEVRTRDGTLAPACSVLDAEAVRQCTKLERLLLMQVWFCHIHASLEMSQRHIMKHGLLLFGL